MIEAHRLVPPNFRAQLTAASLDNLALMRALDRALPRGIPLPGALVRALGEGDADNAEALWALDQPADSLSVRALLRETLASLKRQPEARAALVRHAVSLGFDDFPKAVSAIRAELDPSEAYSQVPGRDKSLPPKTIPRVPNTLKPSVATPEVGRNRPCPCGSGKKLKQCCLGKPV